MVHDAEHGDAYVFYGWSVTTTSRQAHFIKSVDGRSSRGLPWTYHATSLDALLQKFPDIKRFLADDHA